MLTDLLNRYGGVGTYLGFDLVAIFLMTYILYFRRHWRADLLLSYVALNLGIFVTMSLLTQVRVDIAVGFGLFAILSIIRLRSSAVTQQEVAYYFIALVLGLVNGMEVPDRGLVVGMNVVLLLTMLAFDSKSLRDRSRRMDVRLDGVYTNEAALVAELERKLGGRVAYQEITEIDLMHGHMLVDVRLQPGRGVIEPPPPKLNHHPANGATPAPGSDPPCVASWRQARAWTADTTMRSGTVGDPMGRGARRVALRPVAALLALAMSAAVAGCAGGPRPAEPVAPAGAASGALVMVIRHGEKPNDSHPGIDAQGNEDDSSLTETGWERANRLADLFDPDTGSPRPGLATPKAIYAAGANDEGEGLRPRETVMPLVSRLGLTANTGYGAGDEKKLVEQVVNQPGPTLISWQHGGIPDIAKAFPAVTPKPPSDWPDDRFDIVWTFTKTADGWQFAQVPELVLPADHDTLIKN